MRCIVNYIWVMIIISFASVPMVGCMKDKEIPEPVIVIEERTVTEYIEKECPEVVCPECPTVTCSVDLDLGELRTMNRRLAERLKEQYAKDPLTRGWSRLCLPDEYECLLQDK